METYTPVPKDVVIVLDKSGSMSSMHDGLHLMDIAKEAAYTVLDTLNPNDRVSTHGITTLCLVRTQNSELRK